MAIKFASILAALGMGSSTEPVTEAHLEAADAKIAQLEEDKKAADLKADQAAAALKTAQDEQTKTAASLKTAEEKVDTLQTWKDNQAKVDNRDEDDSNTLDKGAEAAAEPWEKMAAATIARTKKSLGEK
jgi:hypothetical protein